MLVMAGQLFVDVGRDAVSVGRPLSVGRSMSVGRSGVACQVIHRYRSGWYELVIYSCGYSTVQW